MGALSLFVNESIRQISLGYKSYFASAHAATQKFSNRAFVDLYDYVQEAKARRVDAYFQHTCDLLMNNISYVVLNNKQHSNPQAYGISIYFPEDPSDYDTEYGTTIDLGQETDWDLFLTTYHTGPAFRLSLASFSYNDSTSISPTSNNGNGILEQGETVNVSATIKNTGSETAFHVNGTLISSDTNITTLMNFHDYGTIADGSQNSFDFQFNISESALNSQIFTLIMMVQGMFGSHYVKNDSLYIIVNISAIFGGDSFENAIEINEGVFSSLMPGLDPYDLSAWFKIQVNESKYLITSILNAAVRPDYDIYIYHPSGFLLTIAGTTAYPDTCSTLAPVSGYYRLRIYPDKTTGIFTLNVSVSDTPGPEDGNWYGTAISFNPTHTTEVGSCPNPNSSTGYMYYRVYLEAGEGIRATLRGDSYEHDFDLYLYDSNFEVITFSWKYNYPEEVSHVATHAGYVYIVVVPYSGNGIYELELVYFDPAALPEWAIWFIIICVALAVVAGLYMLFKKRS